MQKKIGCYYVIYKMGVGLQFLDNILAPNFNNLPVLSNEARSCAWLIGMNIGIVGVVCHLECRTRTAKVRNTAVVHATASARVTTDRREVVSLAEGVSGANESHENKESRSNPKQSKEKKSPFILITHRNTQAQGKQAEDKGVCHEDADRSFLVGGSCGQRTTQIHT